MTRPFYNTDFIKEQTTQMVSDYLQGQIKLQNVNVPALRISEEAKAVVERSYKSFLSDDFGHNMQDMIPLLCASNQ